MFGEELFEIETSEEGGAEDALSTIAVNDDDSFEVETIEIEDGNDDDEEDEIEDAKPEKKVEKADKPKKQPKAKPEEEDDLDADVAFIERLNKTGLIEIKESDLGEDDTVATVFKKKMDAYVVNQVNSTLATMGMAEREAVEALFSGSKLEDIMDIASTPTYNYTQDQLEEDVELQKKLILEARRAKGDSEKDATRFLKGLDTDEVFDVAKEALSSLSSAKPKKKETLAEKRQREALAIEKQREETRDKVLQAAKAKMDTLDSFIPNKRMQAATKEQITSKVLDVINKVYTDLPKYGVMLSLLDHYGLLDGNFSQIQVSDKSDAKSLKEKLASGTKKLNGGSASTVQSSSDDTFWIDYKTKRKSKF